MRDVLQQILKIPGTIGALTYSSGGAVLATDFPGQYGAQALAEVTRLLSEDFLVQQSMVLGSGGLDLKYSGGRLVVRPFSGGAILALCAVGANIQLLHLALVQAVHRLEKGAIGALPGTVPDSAPKASPKAASPVVDLIKPGPLAALKQAFLVQIGPIGDMLFSRIYADWSSGAASGTGAHRYLHISLVISDRTCRVVGASPGPRYNDNRDSRAARHIEEPSRTAPPADLRTSRTAAARSSSPAPGRSRPPCCLRRTTAPPRQGLGRRS